MINPEIEYQKLKNKYAKYLESHSENLNKINNNYG